MSERHTLHPLTPAQQEFAAENHELVFQYLRIHGLPEEEFYSEVILRYLSAVQRYDERPELRQYNFRTIAFTAMDSAVGNYRHKQHRQQMREISLEEPAYGCLTLAEVIGQEDPGFTEVEQREDEQRLMSLVTEQEGNIIRLKLKGYTHSEAGQRLGVSDNSIGNRLHKMRLRMKSGAQAAA